jgi:hypothetical protein
MLCTGHLPEVMIMPGEARASARPLPRLARLLMSRNDLRRPSDRIERAVLVTLAAAFLAAVVAASVVGAHMYNSQRATDARLRPAVAVLAQSGPTEILTGSWQARARWRAPDGRPRAGYLTTLTAPGIWNAAAGTRVPVWLTSSGEPAAPPPGQMTIILNAFLIPFSGAGGVGIGLIICYRLCRLALDRWRLAAWESDWALIGPRWTSRR